MIMNIGQIDNNCTVLGPGRRYVIWVQGCIFNCKGCYNEKYKSFDKNMLIDTEEIIEDIIECKDKIEGITLLGGEPLLQAKQLCEIAKIAQENGLTVICYTGFYYSDLLKMNNENVNELLKCVDVLIDGPYIDELRELKYYRGSSNQTLYFLTSYYSEKDFNVTNSYEINITKNKISIKGFFK